LLNFRFSAIYAFGAMVFHCNIFLLQGVDFLGYWLPALLAFLTSHGTITTSIIAAAQSWQGWLALLYVGAQLLCVLTFRDLRSEHEILPLSSYPLYTLPRNLFDDWPKSWCMSSHDLRQAGNLDPFYYNPLARYQLSDKDMLLLPDQRLFFGNLRQESMPNEMRAFVHADFKRESLPFYAIGNIKTSRKLHKLLQQVILFTEDHDVTSCFSTEHVAHLLNLQDQCMHLFREEAAAAQLALSTGKSE
jgi:hypothetical protein